MELIILCAMQRSGTTVFQRTLEKKDYIISHEEIFHSKRYFPKKNNLIPFFNYANRYYQKYPDRIIKTNENVKSLWSAYYHYLLNNSGDNKYLILDIKYNSWHNLNTIWHYPNDRPFLMRLLENVNPIIIHITRQNVFEQYISTLLARVTGIYHSKTSSSHYSKDLLTINPQKCEHYINNVLHLNNSFAKWLKPFNRSIKLDYENIFENNKMTDYTINKLAKYINIKAFDLDNAKVKKSKKDYNTIIKNTQELHEYFKNKEYYEFIAKTLAN